MNKNIETSLVNEILVIGSDRLACTIAINLTLANEKVRLLSDNYSATTETLHHYINHLTKDEKSKINTIQLTEDYQIKSNNTMVIISKECDQTELKSIFNALAKNEIEPQWIGVANDYLSLDEIQCCTTYPEKIFGMNWVLPAHHTFFLELIHNQTTTKGLVETIAEHGSKKWNKDPYIVSGEQGIRSKMISALIREAFYLVSNGYASLQDIDRACRNDAGTYLPFAGNFRYMDLMGTFAYGKVMQELNKELSKSTEVPVFFKEIVDNNHLGMKTKQGFYSYTQEEIYDWEKKALTFSGEIKDIMERYPFDLTKANPTDNKIIHKSQNININA
ncbi:3-hydroxyacyl-CoA dehydrogenase family protein [Membranihabitans marinus]|uniref:3-hydroxyacyl-CoA dehydrogenase family protein n=1 Tax=Membranihabitans marinus TaxID=1227546 RepID=UPI001F36915D|nr:3-hydroxyacyl-CoA dehydrogenase family protein [Membranihabitans marinus]